MARRLILLTSLTFLLIYSSALADDAGRYQLFQGEYKRTLVDGSEKYVKALFKVDTKTGELFLCEEVELREDKEGQDIILARRRCQPYEGVFSQPGFIRQQDEQNSESEGDAKESQ